MSSSKPGTERHRTLAAALRYAQSGVHSAEEVRAYLRRRGVASTAIARIVAACREQGSVDDRACARLWAEHWARRGYAGAAIARRLSAKGLDAHTIDVELNYLARGSPDDARARLLADSYLRRHSGSPQRERSLPAPRRAGRLARTLASRGFDSDVIERVLGESFDSPRARAGLAQDEC